MDANMGVVLANVLKLDDEVTVDMELGELAESLPMNSYKRLYCRIIKTYMKTIIYKNFGNVLNVYMALLEWVIPI